jgi:hypothetical protein
MASTASTSIFVLVEASFVLPASGAPANFRMAVICPQFGPSPKLPSNFPQADLSGGIFGTLCFGSFNNHRAFRLEQAIRQYGCSSRLILMTG